MNDHLFKEPAPVFVISSLITMIFLFIETRVRGEKKPYRDYIVYGLFVGILSIVMLYLQLSSVTSQPKVYAATQNFLLDRFPN